MKDKEEDAISGLRPGAASSYSGIKAAARFSSHNPKPLQHLEPE